MLTLSSNPGMAPISLNYKLKPKLKIPKSLRWSPSPCVIHFPVVPSLNLWFSLSSFSLAPFILTIFPWLKHICYEFTLGPLHGFSQNIKYSSSTLLTISLSSSICLNVSSRRPIHQPFCLKLQHACVPFSVSNLSNPHDTNQSSHFCCNTQHNLTYYISFCYNSYTLFSIFPEYMPKRVTGFFFRFGHWYISAPIQYLVRSKYHVNVWNEKVNKWINDQVCGFLQNFYQTCVLQKPFESCWIKYLHKAPSVKLCTILLWMRLPPPTLL